MSPGLLGPRRVRRVLSAAPHHARERSRAEFVRPTGLYLCAEAHSAVWAATHAWPQRESPGAAGAPDSRHRGAHERSVEGAEQPQIQQQRCEHPQAVQKAEVRRGVTPGQGRGHAKHHQPPEVVGNSLPQLEVFHHAHTADRTAAVVWSASCPPRATSQVADEASREPDWRRHPKPEIPDEPPRYVNQQNRHEYRRSTLLMRLFLLPRLFPRLAMAIRPQSLRPRRHSRY